MERPLDRILLFDTGQWILTTNPSFDDFLSDEFRSRRTIYEYACQLRSKSEKNLPFIQDVLVELDNHFQEIL